MESPCSFNGQHWGFLRTVKTQLFLFHVDTFFPPSSPKSLSLEIEDPGKEQDSLKITQQLPASVFCLLHSVRGRSQVSSLAGLNLHHLSVNLLTKSLQ